ncbi:hypothetical protein HETIRDRAFT_106572 [Heterobasidion irregulare TC 32-1]|uniref:Carbohydrate esterase family 16 protein n=1 Tax=Heterobasidion irregulare (strain TC 32-1) TaxID=747525 RepID=W4JQU3_HETIT|nr:uncharacterized protein HETIRDRAFT_106572 [Heterobasidion irregulare TC 32-1]ETW75932.1 hypothetical protein HETIRDRAFT_106572 [Heterobasidion irregulare TC 32-1]
MLGVGAMFLLMLAAMPAVRASSATTEAEAAGGGRWPTLVNVTFPLRLAVEPACGSLAATGNATRFAEVNAGLVLGATRTVVAFGDSWTSNGANGTVPVPPVLWPPSPSAGSRLTENRRASNGFIWVENMANALGAKLLNYAWGGAVIDNAAYNTTNPAVGGTPRTDFIAETRLFMQQGKFLDALVPSETLYTVAFGINDDGQFELGGGDYDIAYETYVGKLGELQAAGAKNILVHGMYKSHAGTDALQDRVFAYLREARATNGTNVAFVDLHRLFGAILDDPGAFGVGGCDDPSVEVFWIRHPSATTHELISLYTMRVLEVCAS